MNMPITTFIYLYVFMVRSLDVRFLLHSEWDNRNAGKDSTSVTGMFYQFLDKEVKCLLFINIVYL